MNKAIINRGSFKLDEVVFEQGTTTIGRANNNTIILDDSAVSSYHAKIVTLFKTSYIEDLDSTNGTMVNGKTVKKRTLHPGDIVSLGSHQLLFQSDEPRNKVEDDTSATVVLKGSEIKQRLSEFMQAQADTQNSRPSSIEEPRTPYAVNSIAAHKVGNPAQKAGANPIHRVNNSDANHSADTNKEQNQAWFEAKRPATGVPAADKIPTPKTNTDVPDSEDRRQPIRNTAAAIRYGDNRATPPLNSTAAASAATASPAVEIAADIATAARLAQQSRRTGDTGKKPAGMRGNRGSINMAREGFAAQNSSMALGHSRPGNKILPKIWLVIAAVLVAEVIYITYRSLA